MSKEKDKKKDAQFMKVKPLKSLLKTKKEAKETVKQSINWHVPSSNSVTIPQIVINLPPLVIRTEPQQVTNHQVGLSTRHTLQPSTERTSSHDFLKDIPTSVPEDFLIDIPTISIPSPPTISIPSPPEITLSHLLNQPQAAPEDHSDMEVEDAPVVTTEEEVPPVVAPDSEVDPVAYSISLSPTFDVRNYCFSPDSDTGSANATVDKVSDSDDV